MLRIVRSGGLTFSLCFWTFGTAFAQAPPLVFTVATPERSRSETILQTSAVVEERGLALWGGATSDFGVGVALSSSRWTIRGITSMTTLPIDNHLRPTFQQVEAVRPVFSTGTSSIAAGGGIREQWDGTRVLIGRVLAGVNVGGGRLQGSFVVEQATTSPRAHDAADVITSLGWSRRVTDRLSVGAEGIGQDLEGFWDPTEADGGAKLLVGPSFHVQSRRGDWGASVVAGPVIHRPSTSAPALSSAGVSDGHTHLGMFVSATWVPFVHR